MYDYKKLKSDIESISPVTTIVDVIGKSVMERDIFCLKTGRGKRKILLTGAHHGLEYITSCFLMEFMRDYSRSLLDEKMFFNESPLKLFTETTLYVVPMVNPDGVDIAVNGLDITDEHHRRLISTSGIYSFRTVWQANARGVDLNHNYDALWHRTVEKPAPSLYGGDFPGSEPETAALCALMKNENFDMLICFHSQGEEIYYNFDERAEEEAEKIATEMAFVSGYKKSSPEGTASYGGCKDWFIKEFAKPGFTVEMGKGTNPLPMECISEIYEQNAGIILAGMKKILH